MEPGLPSLLSTGWLFRPGTCGAAGPGLESSLSQQEPWDLGSHVLVSLFIEVKPM